MRTNILMPITTFMTRYYHRPQPQGRSVSVFHHNFIIFHLAIFTLLAIFVSSCEEGSTQIGSDLLPGTDFVDIFSTDTLSVWSYTMYDDSVRSDNPSISFLGQAFDPYFGTTTAEFVTQIRLGAAWDDKPFTIDSVKLYLNILGVRGGSDQTYTLSLSEIAEQIYTDSVYYSSREVPLTGYELNDIELPVLKADTVNNIVLTLPVEFGNYLTRDTSKFFYSSTQPDFRSYFKGLYFRLSSVPDPLIFALSLEPPSQLGAYENVLILFMHDETGNAKQYFFILDAMNRNASYNRFIHDFTTALPGKKIEHINDGYRDTLSYLQNLNGVYTKIVLPGLEILKSDPSFVNGLSVNKARLTVPVYYDGDLYKASTAPIQLYLRYKTSSGNKYIVPDFSLDQYNSFFDGRIDTIKNIYNFNLAAFVQRYLEDESGEIEPELEFFQQESSITNVILKGNSNKSPVKFEFTYTKF
jgi:hypothetical protein